METLSINNPWNSLEILKLVVAASTPLIVILIGLLLNQKLKKFEHRQWRNQKLIEKRLTIYDEIAPLLNDLLCYFTFVGYWRDCKPDEIVKLKRTLDKKLYLAKPIFSDDFFDEAMAFIDACYKPFQGWGVDAKLLTSFQRRKESFGADWKTDWETLFITDHKEIASPEMIRGSYNRIMRILSQDIGITDSKSTDSQQRLSEIETNIAKIKPLKK